VMEVTLTTAEMLSAALIGMSRHVAALARRLQDNHGYNRDDGWGDHIEGACGELAVAKAIGRYWPATVNDFKKGCDVLGCQVKTRSQHHWDLLVRRDDADDRIFVLVTGKAPNLIIRGWLPASECKQPEYLQTYGHREPAWFVPQAKLRPMDELPPP